MFERAKRTLKLAELFRGANGTLSYAAITEHMGQDLSELRHTITSVRRYLERDEGIVFECVRGEGYRRLTDSEKIESAATFQHKIRRTAVRGVMRIDAVTDPGALSNDDQLAASIRKTVFEAVQREAGAKI